LNQANRNSNRYDLNFRILSPLSTSCDSDHWQNELAFNNVKFPRSEPFDIYFYYPIILLKSPKLSVSIYSDVLCNICLFCVHSIISIETLTILWVNCKLCCQCHNFSCALRSMWGTCWRQNASLSVTWGSIRCPEHLIKVMQLLNVMYS
jgi:hypothetical protein